MDDAGGRRAATIGRLDGKKAQETPFRQYFRVHLRYLSRTGNNKHLKHQLDTESGILELHGSSPPLCFVRHGAVPGRVGRLAVGTNNQVLKVYVHSVIIFNRP